MASGRASRAYSRRRPRFLSRKTAGGVVFDAANLVFLSVFSATILYPFWSTLLLSFSPVDEATSMGFRIWVHHWTTTAYKFALSRYGNVSTGYVNSVLRTGIGTPLAVLATMLAAYPLSKRNLPGRTFLTLYVLITMFFTGGLIPTYLVIRSYGLIDNRLVLILPLAVSGFNVVIMRNFLMTIDRAYEDSAFIDGANYLQILMRIVMPLSKPVLATIALWVAVAHWNAWFDALIYINDERKLVLQLILRRMVQQMTFEQQAQLERFMVLEQEELPTEAVKAAVVMLTIGPIVLFYPFLQKYFVKGVLLGSLKG